MIASWPIARATARERILAPFTLVCFAVLFLLGWMRNGKDAWGAEAFSNVSGGWFFLLVLSLGAGLLSDEVDSGHAQLVLLRPITRAQWVSGRLLGAALVLCLGGAIGWATNVVSAVLHGGAGELPGRLLVLPLALLPALGWLTTAAALSAVVRGPANSLLLLGARAGWLMTRLVAPFVITRVDLAPILNALDPFVGPQDAVELARQAQVHEALVVSPALWDLFWFFAAWALAISLFNHRELARRRV